MSRFLTPSFSYGLSVAQPTQIEEALATKPFKFIVGPAGKEYYIHKALVSRLSAPLNALLNGGMKESQEGCATWADVDEDVFLRFAQFTYTGQYAVFTPAERGTEATTDTKLMAEVVDKFSSKVQSGSDVSALKMVPRTQKGMDFDFDSFLGGTDDLWDHRPATLSPTNDRKAAFKLPYSLLSYRTAATEWNEGHTHASQCKNAKQVYVPPVRPLIRGSQAAKRKADAMCDCDTSSTGTCSEKKRAFISAFMAKRGDTNSSFTSFTPAKPILELSDEGSLFEPHRGRPQPEPKNFEPVFVGHARLWVFADLYGVTSLMDQACAHLVRELSDWVMTADRFVAEFGGLVRYVYDDQHTCVGCQLRLLVAQFAACVIEDVDSLEGWSQLVNEMPDFPADLMRQMTNRFG